MVCTTPATLCSVSMRRLAVTTTWSTCRGSSALARAAEAALAGKGGGAGAAGWGGAIWGHWLNSASARVANKVFFMVSSPRWQGGGRFVVGTDAVIGPRTGSSSTSPPVISCFADGRQGDVAAASLAGAVPADSERAS